MGNSYGSGGQVTAAGREPGSAPQTESRACRRTGSRGTACANTARTTQFGRQPHLSVTACFLVTSTSDAAFWALASRGVVSATACRTVAAAHPQNCTGPLTYSGLVVDTPATLQYGHCALFSLPKPQLPCGANEACAAWVSVERVTALVPGSNATQSPATDTSDYQTDAAANE